MSDGSPVRVGSLGVGRWGSVLAGKAAAAGAEIVACYGPTPQRSEEFAAAHGCRPVASAEALVEDPSVEAVLVATPHTTHGDMIRLAASNGKHVFVDKPLTVDLADAASAVEDAERAKIVLQVGHQRRRMAAVRKIQEMRAQGMLGDIELYEAQQSAPSGLTMSASSWKTDPAECPLGSFPSHGVHMIDILLSLEGPVERVSALSRPGGERSAIDLATVLSFEFASGALATLASSFFVPKIARLAVCGTGGVAVMDGDGATLSFTGIDADGPEALPLPQSDPVLEEMGEFLSVVRSGGRPEVDGNQGLGVVAVLDAARRSVATGSVVEVSQLPVVQGR